DLPGSQRSALEPAFDRRNVAASDRQQDRTLRHRLDGERLPCPFRPRRNPRQPYFPERLAHQVRGQHRSDDQGNVQLVVAHPADKIDGDPDFDVDGQLRQLGGQPSQYFRQLRIGDALDHSQPDVAGERRAFTDRSPDLADVAEHAVREGDQGAAPRGDPAVPRRTLEQAHAELRLELRNPLRNGGGGGVQSPGGPLKAAFLLDGAESFELLASVHQELLHENYSSINQAKRCYRSRNGFLHTRRLREVRDNARRR